MTIATRIDHPAIASAVPAIDAKSADRVAWIDAARGLLLPLLLMVGVAGPLVARAVADRLHLTRALGLR